MKVTQAQWEAKGAELFGDDKEAWRFVCPTCGNALSVAEAKQTLPEIKGRGWSVESECIGRYTDKAGCNWAAYGLFRGPVFVTPSEHPDKQVPVFDFAGRPFTGTRAP